MMSFPSRASAIACVMLTVTGAVEAQKAEAVAATSQELIATFRSNAALADETYTDKRVAVTGPMDRIAGVRLMDGTEYYFEMSCGAANVKYAASFRFNESDRKQLARLKVGQQVTIEGLCKGLSQVDEDGRQVVYFCDCTITNIRK